MLCSLDYLVEIIDTVIKTYFCIVRGILLIHCTYRTTTQEFWRWAIPVFHISIDAHITV